MNDSNLSVMTFGCRLNVYESQVMQDLAQKAGFDNAIIVNTCNVTNEARRQAKQAIRKARRDNPDVKIIVTGCAAQIKADDFLNMNEVDFVIGNDEKMKPETYNLLQNKQTKDTSLLSDIMAVKETALHMIDSFQDQVRAFLQVQNGCDHRCTFCTIPFGRGNSRSIAIGAIVEQVKKLVKNGYREVVLTGVDITSYGEDLPGKPRLGQMVKRVLNLVPELPRLRISSIDSVEMDDDLFDLIAHEKRFLPHLHLSLQAGDDMVLKRMKRRHLRHDAIVLCKHLRELRPDITFGADLIAGFPTETDVMFENSLKIVDECDLTFLHVFPYSPHSNTPSSKMPQVAKAIIKERAAKLRQKGQEKLKQHMDAMIGKTTSVLLETNNQGHTDQFFLAQIDDDTTDIYTAGTIINVIVTRHDDAKLFVKPL